MDIQKETVTEFKTGHGTVGDLAAAPISTLAFFAVKKILIKADLENSDNVYVGYDANVSDETGYMLDAGEEVSIPIDVLTKIFVIGGDADQGYSWLVI